MVYTYIYPDMFNPLRPLIRHVVRNRHERKDEYILEIREFHSDYKQRPSPFVVIKDVKKIMPNRNKQLPCWIPVHLCYEVVQYLLSASPNKDETKFDFELLDPILFTCEFTKRQVELEKVGNSVRLRSFMEVKPKATCVEDDPQEIIELRNESMSQLIQFLTDVSTRYRDVKGNLDVSSLFSLSGGRRFYFDLRDTRWGKRLHISQVTDLHRNVIGIPLESLISFRDRLNEVIRFLKLDDNQKLKNTLTNGRIVQNSSNSNEKPRSKYRKHCGDLRQGRSKSANSFSDRKMNNPISDDDSDPKSVETQTNHTIELEFNDRETPDKFIIDSVKDEIEAAFNNEC